MASIADQIRATDAANPPKWCRTLFPSYTARPHSNNFWCNTAVRGCGALKIRGWELKICGENRAVMIPFADLPAKIRAFLLSTTARTRRVARPDLSWESPSLCKTLRTPRVVPNCAKKCATCRPYKRRRTVLRNDHGNSGSARIFSR